MQTHGSPLKARLIETFVISWYSTFTNDITFLNELRFSLQYATATAVNKFLEIDIGSLIANKMVPCAIKHIDDYLCMQQIAKLKNVNVNRIAVDYLGNRLHIATTNRENELNYLRQLTSCLMPKLLPEEYLNCRSRKYYENTSQGTVAKISSGLGKIKGALQTKQPVEGYAPESQVYENDATHFIDDVMPHITGFRDLTTWRVSIRNFDTVYVPNNRLHNYYINIERIDTLPENELRRWNVQRRDNDFYTLKAKLIEFHGESQIPDLPPKRQLLQKPLLRSSDLLYTFLTTEQNFTETINSSVTGVDLENIYQSVAYKLRKEKGQHLDAFMNTFLTSTGKAKQNKVEWAEIGDELDNLMNLAAVQACAPKTFHNKIFGNNFDVTQRKVDESASSTFNPSGVAESLFYLCK
ncbi:sorting nexin [Holotrichia oblita]|uniref:Sorting nexin n=1 Tax=Holotrichia oblita TaxID=644536 RepID=A0ACB9TUM1_HOLOL|nr:sorting nexin [Holotrichia oblita]